MEIMDYARKHNLTDYTADESGMTGFQKTLNALFYEIGRNDLEYADNLRIARRDDQRQFESYLKKQKEGCCGSFDTCVSIDGIEWLIGCNYGH
jgi:hypothetical protein